MATMPKPASPTESWACAYDAWNRPASIPSGPMVYYGIRYDGLNRQTMECWLLVGWMVSSNCRYYTSSWQLVETRSGASGSTQPENAQPTYQYVWSPRYIDAAVLRDKNTDSDGLCDDQRLYFLNDANYNVTCLVDTAGDAVECYAYSAYGSVSYYTPAWSSRGSSSYGNVILFAGRELDTTLGLYRTE
jgi:hypothetical protein